MMWRESGQGLCLSGLRLCLGGQGLCLTFIIKCDIMKG